MDRIQIAVRDQMECPGGLRSPYREKFQTVARHMLNTHAIVISVNRHLFVTNEYPVEVECLCSLCVASLIADSFPFAPRQFQCTILMPSMFIVRAD